MVWAKHPSLNVPRFEVALAIAVGVGVFEARTTVGKGAAFNSLHFSPLAPLGRVTTLLF